MSSAFCQKTGRRHQPGGARSWPASTWVRRFPRAASRPRPRSARFRRSRPPRLRSPIPRLRSPIPPRCSPIQFPRWPLPRWPLPRWPFRRRRLPIPRRRTAPARWPA
ncbi:MAG: hypothetical protein F4X69_10525, partial [Gemmatimonadetes bacterium]|nr:hypothetical protein [Gemmatimonadota bacterium]